MLESANKYIATISSIVTLIALCLTFYNWLKLRQYQRSLDVLNARMAKMDASAKRFHNMCTSNIQALRYSVESKPVHQAQAQAQVQAQQVQAQAQQVQQRPSPPPSSPPASVVQQPFLTPDFFEPVRTTTFVISSKSKVPPPMQSIIEEIDTDEAEAVEDEEDEMEEVGNVKDLDVELEAELEELEK